MFYYFIAYPKKKTLLFHVFYKNIQRITFPSSKTYNLIVLICTQPYAAL
jgi:hypothetical protein